MDRENAADPAMERDHAPPPTAAEVECGSPLVGGAKNLPWTRTLKSRCSKETFPNEARFSARALTVARVLGPLTRTSCLPGVARASESVDHAATPDLTSKKVLSQSSA